MASRVTRNILGALASGANAALLKNMALREDQQQYNLGRQRWRGEEAERRKLQLGYGEEDYGTGRQREEGEYGVKRSRALNEHKENLALKDAERERMIGAGALIGKEINDPRYAQQTIAKVLGLPNIPDLEARQLERGLKQSQIDYYNARGEKASGSSALKTGKSGNPYSDMTHVTNALMKYEEMLASDGRIDPATGEKRTLDSDTKLWLVAQVKRLREHQDLLTKLNSGNAQSVAAGGLVGQTQEMFNQIIRDINNRGASSPPATGSTQAVFAPEIQAGPKALADPVAPRPGQPQGPGVIENYTRLNPNSWLFKLLSASPNPPQIFSGRQGLASGTPGEHIRTINRQYHR